jgi:hypothetical protein
LDFPSNFHLPEVRTQVAFSLATASRIETAGVSQRIADEIVAQLTSLVGAKAKVTIEIDVEFPNGIPEDRVRIVSENSNTLKFKGHEFEEG